MSKSKKKKHQAGPSLRREVAEHKPAAQKSWLKKYAIWVVLATCLLVFFLNLNGGDYKRRNGFLTFDESVYSRLGFQLKNGKEYNTQELYQSQVKQGRQLPSYLNDPIFKHPPAFPFMISMMYVFLEEKSAYPYDELYSMSVKLSNLMGCLIILLTFLIGRKLFGYRVGMLAALLLAVDLNLTICSQKAWMETTVAFFTWLTLYLLLKSVEQKEFFYLAGVSFGGALLTKYPTALALFIFLTYAVLYHRHIFRQKEFYIFLLISGLMFLPWIMANYKVYEVELLNRTLFHGQGYKQRVDMFFMIAASVIGICGVFVWSYSKYFKNSSLVNQLKSKASIVLGILITLFVGYLCIQAPFLKSIVKSLSWTVELKSGWEMALFGGEPWYFYFKQYLEYSPLYLLFYLSLFKVPFGKKEDKFLLITALWLLGFGTLWHNFQGRYVLSFSPAGMILVASGISFIFQKILNMNKSILRHLALGSTSLVVVYFIVKSIRVVYVIAYNSNVAYF